MDTPTEDLLNFNEENEATEQGGFEDFVPVSAPEAEQKSAFNEEISSTTEPEKDVDDSNLVDTTEADTPVEDAGEEVMDEKEPESSPTPSCTSDSGLFNDFHFLTTLDPEDVSMYIYTTFGVNPGVSMMFPIVRVFRLRNS